VLKCLLAVKNDTISQIQTTGCNLFSNLRHWLITIKNSAKKKRRLFVHMKPLVVLLHCIYWKLLELIWIWPSTCQGFVSKWKANVRSGKWKQKILTYCLLPEKKMTSHILNTTSQMRSLTSPTWLRAPETPPKIVEKMAYHICVSIK